VKNVCELKMKQVRLILMLKLVEIKEVAYGDVRLMNEFTNIIAADEFLKIYCGQNEQPVR